MRPLEGYSAEHTVNTGRSVYKVDVIDDTVVPHDQSDMFTLGPWHTRRRQKAQPTQHSPAPKLNSL